MNELRLLVPTYNGKLFPNQVRNQEKPEFGEPFAPVLIREAGGLRVVLGTHEYDNDKKPDIYIERQPHGWAILLHPLGNSDPSASVYLLDDGRSFLVKELAIGPTASIRVLECQERVPGIDESNQQ